LIDVEFLIGKFVIFCRTGMSLRVNDIEKK